MAHAWSIAISVVLSLILYTTASRDESLFINDYKQNIVQRYPKITKSRDETF